MVVLFAALIWILLLWFLLGLCRAARVGDDAAPAQGPVGVALVGEPGDAVGPLELGSAPKPDPDSEHAVAAA
jgi:hypothetical protein